MTEQIAALAAALGHVEAGQDLRTVCHAAQENLTAQLRPGLSPADCGEAFILAAAYLALGTLETLGDSGVSSFTAGEVSVRRTEDRGRMNRLEQQAARLMQPSLKDRGFLFRGVRG